MHVDSDQIEKRRLLRRNRRDRFMAEKSTTRTTTNKPKTTIAQTMPMMLEFAPSTSFSAAPRFTSATDVNLTLNQLGDNAPSYLMYLHILLMRFLLMTDHGIDHVITVSVLAEPASVDQ